MFTNLACLPIPPIGHYSGAPGRIRTYNNLFRRQGPYPIRRRKRYEIGSTHSTLERLSCLRITKTVP